MAFEDDPVAYKIKEYKDYLDKKEEVETSFNSSGKQWFKFTKKQIIFQVIIGIAILIIGAYGIKQRTTIKSKATSSPVNNGINVTSPDGQVTYQGKINNVDTYSTTSTNLKVNIKDINALIGE